MRFRIFPFFLLTTVYCLLPILTHAQLTPEDAVAQLSQNVSIVVSPTNPKPSDLVNISIQSYSTNLDQSKIVWSVGGKVEKSGIGEKSLSVQLAGQGSSKTVVISISPVGGTAFQKSITIRPSEIDLMWKGNTYAPPFYKGRALCTNQSSLTIFAVPHVSNSNGKEINPSTLIYKWSRNDSVLVSQSGVGKSTITLSYSIFPAPQKIQVDVSSGGDVLASESVIISPTGPELLVYEDNPLLGALFNTEVGKRISLREKEITFSVYPLFFGTTNRNDPALKYSWSANGSIVGQNTNKVTFRAPDTAGFSNLSIHAESSAKFTQTADKSFGVEFGNTNNF